MGASASTDKFGKSVSALTLIDVAPDDAAFWDELWKIPGSAEEVFELISPRAARKMRDERFGNMATLFTQATAQLCQIVETPYNIYFDQALNCVRVLTRILPFLLEKGDLGEYDAKVEHLCWGIMVEDDNDDVTILSEGRDDPLVGRVVGGDSDDSNDCDDCDGDGNGDSEGEGKNYGESDSDNAPAPITLDIGRNLTDGNNDDKVDNRDKNSESNNDNEEGAQREPLALLVVHAVMHMLFLPQFTCDFYEEEAVTLSTPIAKAEHQGDGRSCATNSNYNHRTNRRQGHDRSGSRTRYNSSRDDDSDDDNRSDSQSSDDSRSSDASSKIEDLEMRERAGLGDADTSIVAKDGVPILPRPASIAWCAGCGIDTSQIEYEGGTRQYDSNRVEVLRLLLASCCDPLFSAAAEYNPLASRWLSVAVAADAPNASCLFYSLLNTVLSYDPNGIGVPYSSSLSGRTHVKLVEISSQVLCVLLDCGMPGSPEIEIDTRGDPVVGYEVASVGGFNMFRTLLARINTGRELTFLHNGFSRLLQNVHSSQSAILPGSRKSLQCFQEVLVLLWKTLEENPLFLTHVLTRCDVTEIVIPICFLMHQSRNDPSRVGLEHVCTFILLRLSGERSFGVCVGSKPFSTRLPGDMPIFSGGHADLIAITFHRIIINGSFRLAPLYSCLLTILCNVSPYWRSISLVAAMKLVNIFELLSSPRFLYNSPGSHKLLALLLEIFNNVIQYQYNGSHHLIYAIVRRKDSFGRLSALTLKRAIAQHKKAYGDGTDIRLDHDTEKEGERKDMMDMQEIQTNGGRGKSLPAPGPTEGRDHTWDIGGDGSKRFRPSAQWLLEMRENLPLETISRLLQHLVPVVDDVIKQGDGIIDEVEILDILSDVTMVGLLPVPHAIVVRKYRPNQYTSLWFTAFLWGVIFLRNQALPFLDGEVIKLFQTSEGEGEGVES